MRPIHKFILHVVHNWTNELNEAYAPSVMTKLMDKFREEADDLNVDITDEQLKAFIERFDTLKNSPKITEKDLFKYSLGQLQRLVTSSKGAEAPEAVDITPDVVYHNDDDTIVIWNGNKENNCVNYGNGEKWCITRGSWPGHRYNESRKNPTFYLAKNNNLSDSDPLSFIVIQVRDTYSESDRYVLHNRTNSPHYPDPISYNELLNDAPWLREVPNLKNILKYQPFSSAELLGSKYKRQPASVREWTKFPFETKKQYLTVRSENSSELFSDIDNSTFISKYLPQYPQIANFVAVTPGVIPDLILLQNLESFSNADVKSIMTNMRDQIPVTYLESDSLSFDVKKLLTRFDKWKLPTDDRLYVTKDGNAIVKLKLGDDISLGIYTAEDDYPSIKLNQRTSKYLSDYPELDKIPFKNLIKLVSDGVMSQELLDQLLEKAKNDPNSAIQVRDTDNGQVIVDSNSFIAYKIENGNLNQIPFDDPDVVAIFDEQDDNEGFQNNIINNLFRNNSDLPSALDKDGLISILNSMPYSKKELGDNEVILTTPDGIFKAKSSPNDTDIFISPATYGIQGGRNWRDRITNRVFNSDMVDAYFNYLNNQNKTISDAFLASNLTRYGIQTDLKKYILTRPNLPIGPDNIFRPVLYNDVVYLINTNDPTQSKKLSDSSGKLIKANINPSAARRLLRSQVIPTPENEPTTEPGNEPEVEPAVAQLQALAAQAGERRTGRGRPAGVRNNPQASQERQRGNVNVSSNIATRGLTNGFNRLPRADRRRLDVDDAVSLSVAGDRGATRRNNLLGRSGSVRNIISVGNSKIYLITLNNGEQIASINIQPGNRNYLVTSDQTYSMNSPSELLSFLQRIDLAEDLRTSMFKLHLQENPYMIDEIKKLKNNPTMEEAYSAEESFKDYSDDALTDMIINSSRFEGNEDAIKRIKQELERRKQSKQNTMKKDLTEKVDTESEFDVIRGGEVIARNVKFLPNGRDYRVGSKLDKLGPHDSTQLSKSNTMTKENLKSYIKEVIKKRLAENQPAPSRETPERGTETIPDRGTEEEKKRRRIGNPNVDPKPKAMNENEQEIIKQIVARFKSKK
jgi:hypothetical protein